MDINQLYDIQTVEVMRRIIKKDSNCIDVGCHAGVFLEEILKFSPNGHHYGFEPLPSFHASLVEKFHGYSNVTLSNSALSDVSGLLTFQHVVSNPGYSGLKQRKYDRSNEIINQITVQTELLDEVIPVILKVAFIKIDVEGAELQVLRGAVETIKRCQPVIVFEHGLGAADFYDTEPKMVFDFFAGCGLRCFTMKDWLASDGADYLSSEEFSDEFYSSRNYYFMAA